MASLSANARAEWNRDDDKTPDTSSLDREKSGEKPIAPSDDGRSADRSEEPKSSPEASRTAPLPSATLTDGLEVGTESFARLSGVIRDIDDKPIFNCYVVLKQLKNSGGIGDEDPLVVQTGPTGEFTFPLVTPDKYRVEVIAAGYKKYTSEESLHEGEKLKLVYRLESEGTGLEVVVRAKRSKPAREVTRRTVSKQEITRIPGTGGDALRAVQNLPGVALSNQMGGDIIIRGSSNNDSIYTFDSINAPIIYHFDGMTSIINADLLESIDYYPGNFSVKYGRATGGAVEVNTRTPNKERLHGYGEVDIYDGTLLLEGPLAEQWSIAVSGRRSWVDGIMKSIDMLGDDIQLTVAPRYYDLQLLVDFHPNPDDTASFLFYGSDDRWEMTWEESDNPNRGVGLDLSIWVYRAQIEWKHRFDPEVMNTVSLGFGDYGVDDYEGKLHLKWRIQPLLIRDEIVWELAKHTVLRIGTDTELHRGDINAYVPGNIEVEGDLYTEARSGQWYEIEGTRFYYYPSLYSELTLSMIPRTQLILGVRGDYFSSIDAWTTDPRLAIQYKLFENTALKGGIGMFHQVPDMQYVDKQYGNPDLDPTRAIQYPVH